MATIEVTTTPCALSNLKSQLLKKYIYPPAGTPASKLGLNLDKAATLPCLGFNHMITCQANSTK